MGCLSAEPSKSIYPFLTGFNVVSANTISMCLSFHDAGTFNSCMGVGMGWDGGYK